MHLIELEQDYGGNHHNPGKQHIEVIIIFTDFLKSITGLPKFFMTRHTLLEAVEADGGRS